MGEGVVAVILIIIILVLWYKTTEKFGGIKIEYVKSGTDTFDDRLFSDVIAYKSDQEDITKPGIFECLKKCDGKCVEYGMTGNAFCFPNK